MWILTMILGLIVLGIIGAANGDWSVLAGLGKIVATIAFIVWIFYCLLHPLALIATIGGLVLIVVVCGQ